MSGPAEAKREVYLLWDSDQIISGVHPKAWCSGQCVVHNPSQHILRDLPLSFDLATKTFYRLCKHGAKHQDPDERIYWTNQKLKARSTKMQTLVRAKLLAFACPECVCKCCDITHV